MPEAPTVKVAFVPEAAVWFAGCAVTVGISFCATVTVMDASALL